MGKTSLEERRFITDSGMRGAGGWNVLHFHPHSVLGRTGGAEKSGAMSDRWVWTQASWPPGGCLAWNGCRTCFLHPRRSDPTQLNRGWGEVGHFGASEEMQAWLAWPPVRLSRLPLVTIWKAPETPGLACWGVAGRGWPCVWSTRSRGLEERETKGSGAVGVPPSPSEDPSRQVGREGGRCPSRFLGRPR